MSRVAVFDWYYIGVAGSSGWAAGDFYFMAVCKAYRRGTIVVGVL